MNMTMCADSLLVKLECFKSPILHHSTPLLQLSLLPSHSTDSNYMAPTTDELVSPPLSLDDTDLQNMAASLTTGEWTQVLYSVAPLLSTDGLRHALGILEQAMRNLTRSKVLGQMIDGTQEVSTLSGLAAFPQSDCIVTCKVLQEQLHKEQLRLLMELKELPYQCLQQPPMLPAQGDFFKDLAAGHVATPEPLKNFSGFSNTLADTTADDADSGSSGGKVLVTQAPSAQMTMTNGGTNMSATTRKEKKPARLSSCLQKLDPERLLVVRDIEKLGFKAAYALKQHFATQGQVVKVFLQHASEHKRGAPHYHARKHASNLGFVHMATAEQAQKVLALGAQQTVNGITIDVQRFQKGCCVEG